MNHLSTIDNKIEQALRYFIVKKLNSFISFVLVSEYPKSGGTWLSQLISNYLDIPFPRNKYPTLKNSLMHGHYLPKRNFRNINNILWLVRDGRDVMISLYHHYLIWNEKTQLNPKDVKYHRSQLNFADYNNIVENLPDFIEYVFCHRPSKFQHFTFMGNWSQFNSAWLHFIKESNNTICVKYEDLLKNTNEELKRILSQSFNIYELDDAKLLETVEKYSFESQAKRKKGIENRNSFLRKGISGDWKNYFNKDSAQVFNEYGGKALIELGYEANYSWLNSFK